MFRSSFFLFAALTLVGAAHANTANDAPVAAPPSPTASPNAAETTAQIFERIRHDPVRLAMFLRRFPKGADLHNHLVGAVYAERWLEWAAQDGLCISTAQARILPTQCRARTGEMSARDLAGDEDARNDMIDALSMRNFRPGSDDRSGHDHFFGTFERFAPVEDRHQGEALADALEQAARDHVVYAEFMISPALAPMITSGMHHPLKNEDFAAARAALAPELPGLAAQARHETDVMEARAHEILQCGTPQARPGCAVTARYLFQAIRVVPAPAVFAQLDVGFELVHADPRFAGLNIVGPEDDATAMRDYDLHMRMFRAMKAVHPDVHLSLHAGELTPGLVPEDGLDHHIRDAIAIAGAERIGHGVDIAWEHDPSALLQDMARKHVAVEIALTSNEEILGIRGAAHPFSLYRAANVPTVLSTDDEGVSRGDLTQEYQRAVTAWNLSYDDLKSISRNGLTYAFLGGESLWNGDNVITRCQARQSYTCTSFMKASEKARLQLALELQFEQFERDMAAMSLFR
ncbi:adenosine deaminase family protein [Neoasaia chiangmaiensis]|uniref:adenosine deaminase family protein n=1 Tax=Neoasaia chiangmaiensis TaxID=320497 RepID=UPI00098B1991|nr:adenosine deaminase [Neoasaia chiangmaiensis]